MVPLKYLSTFRRTFEMPLINCEISFQLKWYKHSSWFAAANQLPEIKITDTKLYVPIVTLSTLKQLKQLESGFKRTVNQNKYQSKKTNQVQNSSKFSRSK